MTGNQNINAGNGSDEKAVIETELNFHSLFTAMTEGVAIHQMIYDDNGKAIDYIIRDVNPAFEKNLGIPADKAKGALGSELYGINPPPYLDIYEHVLRTGDPYYFTTFFPPLERYFEISVFIPREDWFATVFLDVTGSRQAVAELRSTGNKYRRLYESMMDGFSRTDMEGNIREFNSCFRNMLGYTEEELIKLTYREITPEQWHEYENRIIVNQVIPNGYSNVYEKEYRKKDGTIFPVEIRTSLIRDDKGQPEGMWGVVRDITDRKKAELELEQMIDRFNLATRSGNMGVWEWDVINDRFRWDDKMFEIYGVDRDDFSGNLQAWNNVLHPDDRVSSMDEIQQALTGEKEYDCEYRILFKDESVRSIKSFGQVVRDSAGRPLRLTGINFDITEEKKIQESLIISEMFNRGLVESAPVGILFLDPGGVITYENPTLQQMMGLPPGNESIVIGKLFQDLPPVKHLLTPDELTQLLGGKRVNAHEVHYSSIAGKELDLEIYTAPLQSNSDTFHGIIMMVVDITKPISAGKELRESEHKYRRLYESMRDGFVRLDMEKHILDYNSFFLSMTGFTPEDISGMNSIRDIVPKKWYQKVDKIISGQIMVQGYTEVFEIEYCRKDNTTFPVELRLFLNKNQEGEDEGMWAIIRDITERKKMETDLLEMNAVLEQKVKLKTKELQDRVKELERFYKATIDRELRMKEMRARIEELEKQVQKNLPR